jgi:hypothetical protein
VTDKHWTYDQSSGALTSPQGKRVAFGYSGKGASRNIPGREHVRAQGPIPRGEWRIGAPRRSRATGPHIMDLTPVGHNAHGRSAFQIHGDNRLGNFTASSGCIILPRPIREMISASGVNRLVVVA